ncbi:MAG: DinB family protein [Verrucomicrobiota bacterium]
MSTTPAEPTLAPPGAGLPVLELYVARLVFRLRCFRGSREKHTADFMRERATIRELVDSSDPVSRGTRVLIPRPRGLEDSSRHWSVWMTLDHLRITNISFAMVIKSLAKGVVPPGKASTAAVKPDPAVTQAVEAEYEKSCDFLLSVVESVNDLKTQARFEHPWFGPLNAAKWHAVAAMHMGLHREQIRQILEGLRQVR